MPAHVSGNWNNGSQNGVSIVNLNNSSGNSNVTIGGRTLIREFPFYMIYALYIPYHLVKIKPKRAGPSNLTVETP